MKVHFIIFLGIFLCCISMTKNGTEIPCESGVQQIETSHDEQKITLHYVNIPCVKSEGWDTLAQVKFWHRIITLSGDSSLANVQSTRKILEVWSKKQIDAMSRYQLDSIKKILYEKYNIPTSYRIVFTAGKKWFYQFDKISPKMEKAIAVFNNLGIDPFYAQSVLLIESPANANWKSIAGAYGHFQLMPYVARNYGLSVNAYVDERTNFEKSAYASARLFQDMCIPRAKQMCEKYGFNYDEKSLWFKLLVLHNYNAGAGNVDKALAVCSTDFQKNELIKKLWQTKNGNFGNEAQNYSQLALATYVEFEKYLELISKN